MRWRKKCRSPNPIDVRLDRAESQLRQLQYRVRRAQDNMASDMERNHLAERFAQALMGGKP